MRAWRGAVTPPMVMVTATGPACGLHGVVAHAGQQPIGGDRQFVRRARFQNDAELVAGEAAETVARRAAGRGCAWRAAAMTSLGDVEAVGFVEPGEMIDGDQQEAAGGAEANRFLERGAEHLGEVRAVHFAGERIELAPAE